MVQPGEQLQKSCRLYTDNGMEGVDQYCVTRTAPECSPKDSGVDVSSPWPREIEGNQSGHTSDDCRTEHNNNKGDEPMLAAPSGGNTDSHNHQSPSDRSDSPPVLEREAPLLNVYSMGLDEPSDLSGDEGGADGYTVKVVPGGTLSCSPRSQPSDTDCLVRTPACKLKNNVSLTAAVNLARTISQHSIMQQSSGFSPDDCSVAGLTETVTTSGISASSSGDLALEEDLDDLPHVVSSRTPTITTPTGPSAFQGEFAKFVQGHGTPSQEQQSQKCPHKSVKKWNKTNGSSVSIIGVPAAKKVCPQPEAGVFHSAASESEDNMPAQSASDCKTGGHSGVTTSASPNRLSLTRNLDPGPAGKGPRRLTIHVAEPDHHHRYSPPKAHFNVRIFILQQRKVVKLRRQVYRLFRTVFPALPYPRKFSPTTPVLDFLLEQVIDAVKGRHSNKPKALCLDCSQVQDISIVLCRTPRTCIRHLRRKVYRLLRAILPDLQVHDNFDANSDDVDKLLGLVVRCNSSY